MSKAKIKDDIKALWKKAWATEREFFVPTFISKNHQKLYLAMLQWAAEYGCWPSLEELAVHMFRSHVTVHMALKLLERKEVIQSNLRRRVYKVGTYELKLFDTSPETKRRSNRRRVRGSIWKTEPEQKGEARSAEREKGPNPII